MASYFSWRYIYFLTIGLRFLFALSDSYIHPDEQFQSVEVMAEFLGFTHKKPWEFTSELPARSYGPLFLFYGPVFAIVKLMGVQLSPLVIWYLVRLQFMILTWIVTDTCIFRMLPTKQERIKAIFFVLTSYVTHVYQSHCFSNSIETWLVMLGTLIIDNLRYNQDSKRPEIRSRPEYLSVLALGAILAVGIFNRVTMPAFFLIPSWFVLNHFWLHPLSAFVGAFGFIVPALAFVLIDTKMFGSANLSPTITPVNNLIYNSSYNNLSQHGIHPLYTHILVNLPQLLGPSGIAYLFWKFRNSYWKTTPFLTASSGILALSIVPHQELRFLIPVVPLLSCCFDLRPFTEKTKVGYLAKPLLWIWYAFNIVLAVLMGIYHQGGVVPGLEYIRTENQSKTIPKTYIWWRTYSPPIWLLGDEKGKVQTLDIENGMLLGTVDIDKKIVIIDAKGTDIKNLKPFLVKGNYIVTPLASFETELNDMLQANLTWFHSAHFDLDHLDMSNYKTLKPGLGIYELL